MADFIALLLAVASTLVASVGMVLFKMSAKGNIRHMFSSRPFIGGGALFVFGTALMILALQREELSVIFPLTSLTYIWVMLLSARFLGERINKWKMLSVAFIVAGIVLVNS